MDDYGHEHDFSQHLTQLIEKSPVVVCTWRNDEGWPIGYVSENIRQFGLDPEQLRSGRIRYADLIHPADLSRLIREVTSCIENGPDQYTQVYRLRHASGHWIWVEDHTWLLRDSEGKVTSIEGVLIDRSEERRSELYDAAHVEITSLADTYNEACLVGKLLQYAKLLTDSEISAVRIEESDEEDTEFHADEVLVCLSAFDEPVPISHQQATHIFPGWTYAANRNQSSIHNKTDTRTSLHIADDTSIAINRHVVVPLQRKDRVVALIAVGNKESDYHQKDIQLLRKLLDLGWEILYRRRIEAALALKNQQLERMARFDALTGLPNRFVLEERLELAMARGKRHQAKCAIAFVDLDGFKPVNDEFGHTIGDIVLVSLAKRLPATIREGDTVARFGGDEFIFLFVDIKDEADVRQLLDRVLLTIAEPIAFEHEKTSMEVRLSASIGVTFFPQTIEHTASELLRQADQAMYEAKADDTSSIVVYHDTKETLST